MSQSSQGLVRDREGGGWALCHGERDGSRGGRHERVQLRLGSSGSRQCTTQAHASEQVSHQAEDESHERPLTSTERNFVEKELEGAWSQWRDNGERLDVLIITPDERDRVDVAEVFSVPRICKLAEKLA